MGNNKNNITWSNALGKHLGGRMQEKDKAKTIKTMNWEETRLIRTSFEHNKEETTIKQIWNHMLFKSDSST